MRLCLVVEVAPVKWEDPKNGTEDFEEVEVLEVIALGSYVTTIEKKTKRTTGESRSLLITYLVTDSKIQTMWAARQ